MIKNEYEITDGVAYVKCPYKGEIYTVLLDEEDLTSLGKRTICIKKASTNSYYATLTGSKTVHRHLMNYPTDGLVVDHINRNKLDNRRENLRVVTQQENLLNRARTSYEPRGGIEYWKQRDMYRGVITVNGKKHFTKRFKEKAKAMTALVELKDKLRVKEVT